MVLIGQQGGNSASLLEGFLRQAAAFGFAIEKGSTRSVPLEPFL
jgi:hypothetical protein